MSVVCTWGRRTEVCLCGRTMLEVLDCDRSGDINLSEWKEFWTLAPPLRWRDGTILVCVCACVRVCVCLCVCDV